MDKYLYLRNKTDYTKLKEKGLVKIDKTYIFTYGVNTIRKEISSLTPPVSRANENIPDTTPLNQ